MTFHNSKLLLIILSLISAVLLAVLILVVYDIQSQNKEASALLNLANQAAETRTLVQSIRIAQNNAAQEIATFNNLTLTSDKLVPLIDSLEGVSRTLGLDTNVVSVGKIEDKTAVEPDIIRIVIETQGSWAPALSFLRVIESLPHRVMIDELSFSRVKVGWGMRIVLSLYSFN